MMKRILEYVRLVRRAFLFLTGTFVLTTFMVIGNTLLSPWPSLKGRCRVFFVRQWGKMAARVLNMRIRAVGTPPKPPFFLVSNHLSYLDIPLIFTQTDCVFIAKKEVSTWPLLGYPSRWASTLYINRESRRDITRVNELISDSIRDYQGVVLFAEGTSNMGDKIGPYKPSLLQFPASQDMPVSYATLHYACADPDYPAHLFLSWWGDMPFGSHLWNMLKAPPFDATIVFGNTEIRNKNRKILARELWDAANDIFIPVVKTENVCNEKTNS